MPFIYDSETNNMLHVNDYDVVDSTFYTPEEEAAIEEINTYSEEHPEAYCSALWKAGAFSLSEAVSRLRNIRKMKSCTDEELKKLAQEIDSVPEAETKEALEVYTRYNNALGAADKRIQDEYKKNPETVHKRMEEALKNHNLPDLQNETEINTIAVLLIVCLSPYLKALSQINALDYNYIQIIDNVLIERYGITAQQPNIRKLMESFVKYKKPRKKREKRSPNANAPQELYIPTSQHALVTENVIAAAGNIQELELYAARSNTDLTTAGLHQADNGVLFFTKEEKGKKTIFRINTVATQNNTTASKLYTIIESKALHNYNRETCKLNKCEQLVTGKELCDIGIYKTPKEAQAAFDRFIQFWESNSFNVTFAAAASDGRIGSYGTAPLASVVKRDGNTLHFKFNEELQEQWNDYFRYYTPLPMDSVTMSNRAFTLLKYIFIYARLNHSKVTAKGKLYITLRKVQQELHLPSEVGNNNPKRDITDVIEAAVKDINNKYKDNIRITLPPRKDKQKYTDYLENTSLTIEIKGEFYQESLAITANRERIIEDKQEKNLKREARKEQYKANRNRAQKSSNTK